MLLTFRGHLKGEVLNEARRIIRNVVEEIKQRLITEVRRAFAGRRNRFQHSNSRWPRISIGAARFVKT